MICHDYGESVSCVPQHKLSISTSHMQPLSSEPAPEDALVSPPGDAVATTESNPFFYWVCNIWETSEILRKMGTIIKDPFSESVSWRPQRFQTTPRIQLIPVLSIRVDLPLVINIDHIWSYNMNTIHEYSTIIIGHTYTIYNDILRYNMIWYTSIIINIHQYDSIILNIHTASKHTISLSHLPAVTFDRASFGLFALALVHWLLTCDAKAAMPNSWIQGN